MSRPRAILAEDELPQRRELRALLAELWPELEVVAECEDGLAALQALEQHEPDVAFLDIRLPGVSGIEVARAAGPRCQVIFITAYEEYALRAFEEGAVDYLQKPVVRERLQRAIDRSRARLGSNAPDLAAILDIVRSQLAPGKAGIKWLTASLGNSVKMFPIEEVLFFQARDKHTRVVTAKSEGHIRTSLKELLPSLDSEEFWQIHRGVIVRVSAIDSVDKTQDGKLHLKIRGHEEVLPVSSAFGHHFRGM